MIFQNKGPKCEGGFLQIIILDKKSTYSNLQKCIVERMLKISIYIYVKL
jgi:hypothetical protein